MATTRKAAPERESGEVSQTRVWGEVRISLRPGEYENITVTMGEARDCEDTPSARRKTRRAILAECEDAVLTEGEKIRKNWK